MSESLSARGIYPQNIREALSGHPAWVQDEVIAWVIASPGSFTGTSAVLVHYFHPRNIR